MIIDFSHESVYVNTHVMWSIKEMTVHSLLHVNVIDLVEKFKTLVEILIIVYSQKMK